MLIVYVCNHIIYENISNIIHYNIQCHSGLVWNLVALGDGGAQQT